MSSVEELLKERTEIRNDLLALKRPKRLFMNPNFGIEAACGFAGIDLKKAHYSMELTEQAYDKVCQAFPADTMPTRNMRFAGVYQLLGAKNWLLGSNGVIQHPEIETMKPEEYDEFIKAPVKTIMEKFLPRVCDALNTGNPIEDGMNLAVAYGAHKNINGAQMGVYGKIGAKYGYVPGVITNQMIEAPFDFLADQLRGFKGITMDIRRCPDKVKAACDVITPLMIKMAVPPVMRPGLISFIPLHLGPFINQKAFEGLWWPSFEKMIVELDKMGIACSLFVEQDWTNRVEFLARLPKSTIMFMESGDPKVFTETVGKNHVIGGFYDPTITLARTKEQCIDEAKKLLDTVMKCGNYYFTFDRTVLDIKSIDVSKLQAVIEWVYINGKY